VLSAYRTLSRIAFQLINMLNQVIWPEFSRRYGEKADQTARKRYRHGTAAPSGGATLLHFTESFLRRWEADGKVACVPGFFNLLVIVIALSESWQVRLSLCSALPFVCRRYNFYAGGFFDERTTMRTTSLAFQ